MQHRFLQEPADLAREVVLQLRAEHAAQRDHTEHGERDFLLRAHGEGVGQLLFD